jgi:calcium/calmodulin-dependent protein kinase I
LKQTPNKKFPRANKSFVALQKALQHRWLSGQTASDHNLIPEIRSFVAKARLRRGIELVKLANRIEALKMEDDSSEGQGDVPGDAAEAVGEALSSSKLPPKGLGPAQQPVGSGKKSLSKIARGAIFREVVLAKVREMKENEERKRFEEEAIAAEKKQ